MLTILMLDEMLQTEHNQLKASNAILNKVKDLKLINFSDSKNPSEQIRVRAHSIIREEENLKKYNMKLENDLIELRDRIKRKYKVQDSDLN